MTVLWGISVPHLHPGMNSSRPVIWPHHTGSLGLPRANRGLRAEGHQGLACSAERPSELTTGPPQAERREASLEDHALCALTHLRSPEPPTLCAALNFPSPSCAVTFPNSHPLHPRPRPHQLPCISCLVPPDPAP